jgi:hypothetical protein
MSWSVPGSILVQHLASQTHEDLRARCGADQPETPRPEDDMTGARFAGDVKIWK